MIVQKCFYFNLTLRKKGKINSSTRICRAIHPQFCRNVYTFCLPLEGKVANAAVRRVTDEVTDFSLRGRHFIGAFCKS